jgi:hypothetical protein
MLHRCLLEIVPTKGIIPPEDLERLVPADLHDRQTVDVRAPHIRHRRMPQIVKSEITNGYLAAGYREGLPDIFDWLALAAEGMPPARRIAECITSFRAFVKRSFSGTNRPSSVLVSAPLSG